MDNIWINERIWIVVDSPDWKYWPYWKSWPGDMMYGTVAQGCSWGQLDGETVGFERRHIIIIKPYLPHIIFVKFKHLYIRERQTNGLDLSSSLMTDD